MSMILPKKEISMCNDIASTFPEPAILVAAACRTSLTAAAVDITTIIPFRVTGDVPAVEILAPATAQLTAAQAYEFAINLDRLG